MPQETAVADEALPPRQDAGFAVRLYDALRRGRENLVLSPHSAWAVLEMAGAGACGETAAEFQQVLETTPESAVLATRRWHDLTRPAGSADAPELAIANSLWTQQGAAILASYLEALRARGGEIHSADFARAAETARVRINTWVEEHTRRRIRDLIARGTLGTLTRLVLVNAVYFKGKWEEPFAAEATRDQPFFLSTGGHVTASLMYKKSSLWYVQGGGWQAVDLCYRDCNLAMLLIVPDRNDGLPALESSLTSEVINGAARAMRPCEVHLFVPRFRIEQGFVLDDALRTLGLVRPFDPARADFSGIDGCTPPDPRAIFLSTVIQKAFVEVDEAGTEAAAASAAVLTLGAALRPPPVPTVRADHPFVYAIRERRTGELLFLGRVMNPDVVS